jgi:hypothetical protein
MPQPPLPRRTRERTHSSRVLLNYVNPIGRLADETIGRATRWLGSQWWAGKIATERHDADVRELADAMGVVLTESRSFGRGSHIAQQHQPALAAALAIVEASILRVPVGAVSSVTAFAAKARPFAALDWHNYDVAGLQDAFDEAATALRAPD